MQWKGKYPQVFAALAMLAPASALAGLAESSVGVYGSYWNTKDADQGYGLGAKIKAGIVELRGTWFNDVTADEGPPSPNVDIKVNPLELGLAFNFAPDFAFNPYVGAGVGYYFLDTNIGDIDDEVGWYAVLGGEMGTPVGPSVIAELMYRNIDGTVTNAGVSQDVPIDLSGLGANLGVAWRF